MGTFTNPMPIGTNAPLIYIYKCGNKGFPDFIEGMSSNGITDVITQMAKDR